MSYFCRKMNMLLRHMHFSIFFFIFAIFIGTMKAAGRENHLVDLSTREYLVELAGYGEEKLSTVLVSGAVLADACLDEENKIYPLPVSGALVSVTCQTGRNTKSSSAQAITDEYGEFIIDLPSHLHAIPDLEKACLVSVLRLLEDSACSRFFIRKPKAISLSSVGNGIRTYTAGEIRLQDSKAGLPKAGAGKELE